MILLNITIAIAFLSIIGFLIWKIKDKNNDIHIINEKHDKSLKKTQKAYAEQISQIQIASTKEVNETKLLLKNEMQKCDQLQKKIDSTNCIICGKASNGKHFCFSCYSKFKNQSVDIRIKNCKETKIIDYWGNKTESCEDGRKVRSRAEQCIANYFYNNKIRYAYEKPISFAGKILKPDFYLPDYDLYIEYNELKDEEYNKKKDFAMQIYKQLNIKIIIMTKDDRENIYEYFCHLLNQQDI